MKKAVKMALGAVARRSSTTHAAVLAVAERLAASESASSRWIGRYVQRDLV